MFEFTISSSENTDIIENIFLNLKGAIDAVKGIIVKQQNLKTQSLCLAVDNADKEYIKAVILDSISEGIINEYKYDYLKNNICINIRNAVAYSAFIRALVVFDRQTDKDIIKKNLVLENKLNIDSFYNFRLEQLKSRWNDIASVVNESIPIMLQNKSVADITRYFVNSTNKEVNELHLTLSDNNIQLNFENQLAALSFEPKDDYISDVLTEVISISPKKIIVHGCLEKYKEFEQALSAVFYDSVFIVK